MLRQLSVSVPMRPQRQQIFRSDAAAKLDRLEVIAALLERDATNNRALIAEYYALSPPRTSSATRVSRRWRKFVHACRTAIRAVGSRAVAVATSPRLYAALRAIYAFVVDFAIVLGTATAAVAILTAAFVLTAPPV
jgi:hypothetical protein